MLQIHPQPEPASHTTSGATTTSFLHRHTLQVAARGARGAHSRYSVGKFNDLHAYMETTPHWRVALVLLLTPLPGLVAAVVPAFVPLQPPRLGYNVAFFVHAGLVDFFCAVGITVTWLSVTDVPRHIYSLPEVVLVSAVNVALHLSLLYVTARFWRYPIPFSWVLFASIFLVTFTIAHFLVLRSKLWRLRELAAAFRLYAASMLFQSAQILFYPAFTLLFDNVSSTGRVGLTLAFPFIKFALKLALQRLSHGLQDHGAEVAVCGVEICASLYQSTILQVSPTPLSIALIVGLDFLQGVVMVKWFLDRLARVRVATLSGERLVDAARYLLSRYRVQSATETGPHVSAPLRAGPGSSAIPARRATGTQADDQVTLRGGHTVAVTRKEQEQIMQHALETAFLAEEVLLVEYIEVIVPLLHSFFLLLTARLPTAKFNLRLRGFYENDALFLMQVVKSIWLYSLLQCVSLVALHMALQRRYGISGVRQLAFVLERHRLATIGKLMVWPPLILHFTLVQYGVDFNFKFDYT